MIVLLKTGVSEAETRAVVDIASRLVPAPPRVSSVGKNTLLYLLGGADAPSGGLQQLSDDPRVEKVILEDPTWLLASRELKPDDSVVTVGDVEIGAGRVVMAAGPCSVETEDQLRSAAQAAVEGGARLLRGGAFKPRTSPWSFQGLGEPGLEIMRSVADSLGLMTVTEVMAPEDVDLVASYADMLQVGSRSIQNFPLLRAVGRQSKPVLLKRGMMSTIDELLGSAEYILSHGNSQVVLCERGIRSFDPRTRNTFDVSAIPLLKKLSHLPVMADPSHATGRSDLVAPCGLAALAAGADGLMVEVHASPETALSDGPQALRPSAFRSLMEQAGRVVEALGRRV